MTPEEIQAAVADLPLEELKRFCEWFQRFKAAAWDKQFEEDVQAGRLDALAAEARKDVT